MGGRGIPIVYPEPSQQYSLFAESREDSSIYVAFTYRKREGGLLFEQPGEEHEAMFRHWGKTLGDMHAAAVEYPVWRHLPGDPEGRLLGWEREWRFFEGLLSKEKEVREEWRRLKRLLDGLPQERNSFGFIHNDLHIDNLLFQQGDITVLDFDVPALIGSPVMWLLPCTAFFRMKREESWDILR